MTRAIKLSVWVMLMAAASASAAAAYVYWALPERAAGQHVRAATNQEALARGQYLAEHVAVCMDCHSDRDFGRFAGPLQPATLGQGGEVFGHALGLPGELVASNITPAALGSWSDAELAQAITRGVTADGRALFPFMNYPAYAQLCRADLEALLGYLRKLPPIAHETPPSQLDFPLNLIVRAMPRPTGVPEACPDAADTVAHGRYLVTLAGCAECHTRHEGGSPVAGQELAGGMAFPMPGGYIAHSANITPDLQTGIGRWSKHMFVQRFASYRDPSALSKVAKGQPNTPMPWQLFSGMTDADLGAIYDYLRTVAPVSTPKDHALAAR